MSSAAQPGSRVTAERLGPVEGLAERTAFMTISTGGAVPPGPAGTGLQRNSLSRYEYGPDSPCSPVSPRVGHVWRTGQAACSGGWFRPSPNMVQRQQAQQAQMQTARSQLSACAGATAARISSSTAFSIMSDADKKPEDAAAQAKMMLLQVSETEWAVVMLDEQTGQVRELQIDAETAAKVQAGTLTPEELAGMQTAQQQHGGGGSGGGNGSAES
ncbi:hypothetical protein C2E20_3930 [Micractinium conductrix]|uniref:Uncharacterized protein n=1 Tax=Micractinium conductrix TaxID=554055 RepID=A0A2P6VF97_9CHLO|nr:hypothetical protein C2E20_3930 [Micractinium conductrix]|eukprot:PSC72766.1 hypothetical protein C2E20_3930 [Micractinium conductrix]